MNTFELEIWDDELEKVTFYTVRGSEAALSEADRFFEKFGKTHNQAVQELLSLLFDTIGTDYGAIDDFFNRFEDNVTGLPPKGKIRIGEFKAHFQQFPLRLYALRINDRDDLVVLFNGGLKSARTNQESSDLNMKFLEANAFGKRIEQALREKTIIIDEKSRTLKSFDGSDTILL